MSQQGGYYDLGEVDGSRVSVETRPQAPTRTMPLQAATVRPIARPARRGSLDASGTLSLFLPGTGQLLRGEVGLGLFFISSLSFLAAFVWAVATSLDRITETLRVLDLPGAPGVWAICAAGVTAAMLHMASILSADPNYGHIEPPALPPVVPGLASAVFPGWGQVLNGAYKRACLFVACLWFVAATWVLARPEVQAQLEAVRLYVPDSVMVLASPAVRWTTPVVVWALSVYDAAATAAGRR